MIKALFTKGNQCMLCPHNCKIPEGKRGICGVRINKKGKIYNLNYENPSSISIDPVEKKPLYHFYPGKPIFSIGGFGCNFFCPWCQNYDISRESPKTESKKEYSSNEMINLAKENNCKLIAYTYNEPTVFYEYMIEIAKLAKKNKIKNVIVSNGYINEAPLKKLCRYIDAANIDLKFFDEKAHKKYTGGDLENVLETLKTLKKHGVWIEITNLIIPTLNDDMKKFKNMCKWIKANLGEETPLHLSRFYPCYKLNAEITPIETLDKAKKIADKYLKYVYIGNTDKPQNTYCPDCKALIINRQSYGIIDKSIKGHCFSCKKKILIK